MRNNETCVLAGKPGETKKLEEAIRSLIANKPKLKEIGLNARMIIKNDLNSDQMGSQIYSKIEAYIINTTLRNN